MNSQTLFMLKSIEWVEKNELFKSKHSVIVPTHKNVIVVSSKEPQLREREIWMCQVQDAIQFCLKTSETSDLKQFSILIQEGLYINPFPHFVNTFPGECFIELIGVKDVRFVLSKDRIYIGRGIDLVLDNVSLFSRRLDVKDASFSVLDGAHVKLTNVRIHSPLSTALEIKGSKSILEMINCTVFQSRIGFDMEFGSKVFLTNCHIEDLSAQGITCTRGDCHFSATRCEFIRIANMTFDYGVKGEFHDSNFIGRWNKLRAPGKLGQFQRDGMGYEAFQVDQGSCIEASNCSFSFFSWAVMLTSVHTSATFSSCRFNFIANRIFSCSLNSNLTVHDCELNGSNLLWVADLAEGSIEMKNNRIGPGVKPGIAMRYGDKNHPRFFHDIKNPIITMTKHEKHFHNVPTRKEKSGFTREFQAAKAEDRHTPPEKMTRDQIWDMTLLKRCEKCGVFEGEKKPKHREVAMEVAGESAAFASMRSRREEGKEETPEQCKERLETRDAVTRKMMAALEESLQDKPKFGYCQGCKVVCYCSKECQKANWIDHKLVCPDYIKKDGKKKRGF